MSPLLPHNLRMQLSKVKWETSKQIRGFQRGRRRSSIYGSSLDFSDFRPYHPGDDVRQIDWNVYARTNKHYIKRFLDEQELSITIYLDCSNSMGLESEKWEMAKSLAAMVGYTGLANDDRISIIPVSKNNISFSNRKGYVFTREMLSQIESYKPNESTGFFDLLPQFRHPKSSLSFIISDFLEPVNLIIENLKYIQINQQLQLIHLLSDKELNPKLSGDLRLIDIEKKGIPVHVSINRQVLSAYQSHLKEHCHKINSTSRERGIGYIQVSTKQTLDEILFHEIKNKGWLY